MSVPTPDFRERGVVQRDVGSVLAFTEERRVGRDLKNASGVIFNRVVSQGKPRYGLCAVSTVTHHSHFAFCHSTECVNE